MITESEAEKRAVQHYHAFGSPRVMIPEDFVMATKVRDMETFYEVHLQLCRGYSGSYLYDPKDIIAIIAIDKETGKVIWYSKV